MPILTVAVRQPAACVVQMGRVANGACVRRLPHRWRHGVHRYATTRYAALYDGISLTYRLQGGSLAYDIVVAPGADPAAFWERVAGAAGLRVAPDGALALATRAGMIRDAAPVAYQLVGGVRRPVAASYRLGPAAVSPSASVGMTTHARLSSIPRSSRAPTSAATPAPPVAALPPRDARSRRTHTATSTSRATRTRTICPPSRRPSR